MKKKRKRPEPNDEWFVKVRHRCEGHYNLNIKVPKPITHFTGTIEDVFFFVNNGLWFWVNEKLKMQSVQGFKTMNLARVDAANAFK